MISNYPQYNMYYAIRMYNIVNKMILINVLTNKDIEFIKFFDEYKKEISLMEMKISCVTLFRIFCSYHPLLNEDKY